MPSCYQPKYATYRAVYRLAARPYALSTTQGGAGRVQLATIHHAATSRYKLQLRAVYVAVESSSAAAIVMLDLARLSTAPATGNPAITPAAVDPREPTDADTICLALPTSQATEAAIVSTCEWNLGITGAASTNNPPPSLQFVNLLDPSNTGYIIDPLVQVPAVRPLTLEGYAVTADVSAATTLKAYVVIEYARLTQVGSQG